MNVHRLIAVLALCVIGTHTATAATTSTGAVDSKAKILFKTCKLPNYPAHSMRRGEQGSVKVRAVIASDGQVGETVVIASSGSKTLDEATVQMIKTCRASPAVAGGTVVESTIEIPYEWRLPK